MTRDGGKPIWKRSTARLEWRKAGHSIGETKEIQRVFLKRESGQLSQVQHTDPEGYRKNQLHLGPEGLLMMVMGEVKEWQGQKPDTCMR